MELSFDAGDIARWARFSGDYNPIHFDAAEARRAGADDIVVHGMLALLPIKQALQDCAILDENQNKWLRFKALMRAPIVVDRLHTVSLKEKARGRIDFVARRADDDPEQIRGFLASVDPENLFDAPRTDERRVPTILANCSGFVSEFRFVKHAWLWFDSLAFAIFAQSHFDITDFLTDETASAWSKAGLRACIYMQTTHEVFIHPALRRLDASHDLHSDFSFLTYSVSVELASVSERELIGTIQIVLHNTDETILISRFGLLAKPKATNRSDEK